MQNDTKELLKTVVIRSLITLGINVALHYFLMKSLESAIEQDEQLEKLEKLPKSAFDVLETAGLMSKDFPRDELGRFTGGDIDVDSDVKHNLPKPGLLLHTDVEKILVWVDSEPPMAKFLSECSDDDLDDITQYYNAGLDSWINTRTVDHQFLWTTWAKLQASKGV